MELYTHHTGVHARALACPHSDVKWGELFFISPPRPVWAGWEAHSTANGAFWGLVIKAPSLKEDSAPYEDPTIRIVCNARVKLPFRLPSVRQPRGTCIDLWTGGFHS